MVFKLRELVKKAYGYLPFRIPFLNRIDRFYRSLYRNRVVISESYGSKIELQLNQSIDSAIYFDGCFEQDTVNAVLKLVKPGDTVFDIGANVGCHSLLFANLVGPEGKVVAFEPTDWGYKKLSRNFELNNYKNIKLEKLALSDCEAFSSEYKFRSQWFISGARTKKEKGFVNYITLDKYVEEQSINRINLIKIDVDGYECKIIRGGKNIIEKFKPVIIVELGDTWLRSVGDSIESLYSCLESSYLFFNEIDYSIIRDVVGTVKKLPGDSTINVIGIPVNRPLPAGFRS